MPKNRLYFYSFLFIWILLLITICGQEKVKVYELRAIRVLDERYDPITDEQFRYILNKSKEIMKDYFNVNIRYRDMGKKEIGEFLKKYSLRIPESRKKELEEVRLRYNIFSKKISPEFRANILSFFKSEKLPLNLLKEFLPEEERNDIKTYEQLADKMIEVYVNRLNLLKKERVKGELILKPERINLYSLNYWGLILANLPEYDVVLTNVPFMDCEGTFLPPHGLIRGGMICGLAASGKSLYLTVFPLVCDAPFFKLERGKNYPQNIRERNDIIACLLCHELGHLILKYVDEYTHPNCIMNPPKGFLFKEWYDGIIKSGKCPRKHLTGEEKNKEVMKEIKEEIKEEMRKIKEEMRRGYEQYKKDMREYRKMMMEAYRKQYDNKEYKEMMRKFDKQYKEDIRKYKENMKKYYKEQYEALMRELDSIASHQGNLKPKESLKNLFIRKA